MEKQDEHKVTTRLESPVGKDVFINTTLTKDAPDKLEVKIRISNPTDGYGGLYSVIYAADIPEYCLPELIKELQEHQAQIQTARTITHVAKANARVEKALADEMEGSVGSFGFFSWKDR